MNHNNNECNAIGNKNKYRYNDINCNPCYKYCYVIGPMGPQGGIINYADFYALMLPDNTTTVANVAVVRNISNVMVNKLTNPHK